MPEKLLRPADVAELLGVSYDCACQLMKSMRCVNMSRDPNAVRPRWAVTVSEKTLELKGDKMLTIRLNNSDSFFQEMPDNYLPAEKLQAENDILLVL